MLVGGPLLLASLALVMRPLQQRQQAQRHEAGGSRRSAPTRSPGCACCAASAARTPSSPVRRAVRPRARAPACGCRRRAGDAGRRAGAAARDLRRRRHGHRRPPRRRRRDHAGQLVAFYGYTAFLTMPLRTATEFVDKLIRARVAARRVVTVLAVEPDHVAGRRLRDRVGRAGPPDPLGPGGRGTARRPGVRRRRRAGRLTALVAAPTRGDVRRSPHRLGRTTPGRHGVRWG